MYVNGTLEMKLLKAGTTPHSQDGALTIHTAPLAIYAAYKLVNPQSLPPAHLRKCPKLDCATPTSISCEREIRLKVMKNNVQ